MAPIVNPERVYSVYFEERQDKSGWYRCKLCPSDSNACIEGLDANGNHSVLQAHVIRKHCRPPPLPGTLISHVVDFIVQDLHPLKIVDDEGFRLYSNVFFGPTSCRLPSVTEIAEAIEVRYAACRWNVGKEMTNADNIAISVERWKSNYEEQFVSITAHFINKDFKLVSLLLKSLCLGKGENQKDLSDQVEDVLDYYDISDKVSTLTCDVDVDKLDLEVVECFSFTLNRIVEDGMRVLLGLQDHLDQVQKLLETAELDGELKVLKRLNDPQTLFGGRKPTWLELYRVFERQSRLKEAILAVCSEANLNKENWDICRQVAEVLSPFNEVTEEIQSKRHVPASLIIVWVAGLKAACDRLAVGERQDCVKDLILELKFGLIRSFEGVEDDSTLATCTILDPRFKLVPFTDEISAHRAESRLVDAVAKDMAKRRKSLPLTGRYKVSVWDELDNRIVCRGYKTLARAEVESYLSTEILNQEQFSCRGDPLLWWKEHRLGFPHLARLATCYLAIAANSSSFPDSELLTRRNNLGRQHIEQILFLNANSKIIDKIEK